MSEDEDPQEEAESDVPEFVAASTRPHFAEIAEEPVYVPLPRDYASDFGNGVRTPDTSGRSEHAAGRKSFIRSG